MPNINRIRVNNVKYNFGNQFYDDFTMRMYGKNTLYDLANGGGKSVLMLLLLQNLIPNCTLDEKQPIEKLFRTGNGNTTIHSLIEWKLDNCDVKEGYRYMTTGFCARKAQNDKGDKGADATGTGKTSGEEVASVEYFNYVIFYRKYNKNDIINLPLVKDNERISYQALRNYLKDLEHRNMDLIVKIFDKKGEYQRFISEYGLHESQWEIVRGINKTEGHVRTYFETNYRTTRKVVEDLLIEGIIEKAFLVKTERDTDDENKDESMAELLMNIREQLTVLTGRKKDIASYDHQIELVRLLLDKVGSFGDIYKAMDEHTKTLADVYVTGEKFTSESMSKLEELTREKDEKATLRRAHSERLECLKVSKDKKYLTTLNDELNQLIEAEANKRTEIDAEKTDLALKESINDYLAYLEDKAKYDYYVAKNAAATEENSEYKNLSEIVYNIKYRTEKRSDDLKRKNQELTKSRDDVKEKYELDKTLLKEALLCRAASKNSIDVAEETIRNLSTKLSSVMSEMSGYIIGDVADQIVENRDKQKQLSADIDQDKENIIEAGREIKEKEEELSGLKKDYSELKIKEVATYEMAKSFLAAKEKLDKIATIYNVEIGAVPDYEGLKKVIRDRINSCIIRISDKETEIEAIKKKITRYKENRIIDESNGAKKVIEYLRTRHNIYAMFGIDYISALPKDKKEALLAVNPELPFGVIAKEFATICEDDNLKNIDTDNETIIIYDYDDLMGSSVSCGNNAIFVHKNAEYFTSEDTVKTLIQVEEEKLKEITMEISAIREMMTAHDEDLSFVIVSGDKAAATAEDELKSIRVELLDKNNYISQVERMIKNLKAEKGALLTKLDGEMAALSNCQRDNLLLQRAKELSDLIDENQVNLDKARAEVKRYEAKERELEHEISVDEISLYEKEELIKKNEENLANEEEYYKKNCEKFYVPGEYNILHMGDDELRARFEVLSGSLEDIRKDVEARDVLLKTMETGMKRILKGIIDRNIPISQLKEIHESGDMIQIDDAIIAKIKTNIVSYEKELKKLSDDVKNKQKEISRLEGSIDYAIKNIEAAFGVFNYEDIELSKIDSVIYETEKKLKQLTVETEEKIRELKAYERADMDMIELFKDVKRIVERNNISLEHATIIDDTDSVREIFEDTLTRYDRDIKMLDKAKAELVRFKDSTAATLSEMKAMELAATIRDDVIVPTDFDSSIELQKNLSTIIGYITLERDRIEKSIGDMEVLKNNFEEQCLERCLDVKTELDKLPKLSTIMLYGENIQMVGLKIPYVKDEFMKQRMAEYIDRIVAEADGIADDRERMKYMRNSLAIKKLFSVIVTDMNSIKLSLYKRERIKEQSRYLRYEEAVGSTGQSQGIYIQFLIAIINYISGMYSYKNDEVRTKTIFIDNPFGAAKDIYIWEPIFEMLKMNHVQLIVPARGATPAITGRFDVNYVLGQQMTKNRQVTVVVNYTSKTEQEELEYNELTYEQATFDFI